jgi:hypothetical protein
MNNPVTGFSKLSREKNKLDCQRNTPTPSKLYFTKKLLDSDEKIQKLHDEFIENTITNFYIPLGVANFLINGNTGRFRWQSKKALLSLRHLTHQSSGRHEVGLKTTV